MRFIDPRQLLQSRAIPVPPASSFYVPYLPDLHNDPSSSSSPTHALQMYAGYLPARPPKHSGDTNPSDDANLYFLLLKARHTPPKRKLIIWFNGGPGCSSFDGAMMEVGAWRLDGKGGLVWVKDGGSWNEYADILFLDQPVGTGFSYVSTDAYATSLTQAADEVVYFLKQFVDVFPEYSRQIEINHGSTGSGYDVYLAGESFAGQYIPYTADALLKQAFQSPVSLKGIAIGNGFIDPFSQYGTELETMVAKNIWTTSSPEYKTVSQIVDRCKQSMSKVKGIPREIDECDQILHTIVSLTTHKVTGSKQSNCINVYDVRLSDTSPACGMNWPPTLSPMYDYLKRKDVRQALHVDNIHKPGDWIECSPRVGSRIRNDHNSSASVSLLPSLLEKGVKVLLFAGEEDLICNSIGVQKTAQNLVWSGQKGFGSDLASQAQQWYVNGSLAGTWQSARNLTYVGIKGASHMVGVDVPVESHDMILRFLEIDYMRVAGPNALIPSRVGSQPDRILVTGGGGGIPEIGKDGSRVIPGSGKTEQEVADEARWRAYYNAGSLALVVLLIAVTVGTCILLRLRRRARFEKRMNSRLGRGGALGLPSNDESSRAQGEQHHELERLVRSRSLDNEDVDNDTDSDRYEQKRQPRSAPTTQLPTTP